MMQQVGDSTFEAAIEYLVHSLKTQWWYAFSSQKPAALASHLPKCLLAEKHFRIQMNFADWFCRQAMPLARCYYKV